jgi:hypothetical protein
MAAHQKAREAVQGLLSAQEEVYQELLEDESLDTFMQAAVLRELDDSHDSITEALRQLRDEE